MSKFLSKIEADGMAVVLSDDGSRRIPMGRGHVAKLQAEAVAELLSGGDMSWHKAPLPPAQPAPAMRLKHAEEGMAYRRGIMVACDAMLGALVDSGCVPNQLRARFFARVGGCEVSPQVVRDVTMAAVAGTRAPVASFAREKNPHIDRKVLKAHIDELRIYRYETDVGLVSEAKG